MREYIRISDALLTLLFILTSVCNVQAQTQTLPEIKFPELDYKPALKTGWVGQYVYELHFWDSVYFKSGKYEKRLWVRTDQIKSGYIEFPKEVKGALRFNQPDKYNGTRYEGWIRSGTSYAWSKINDTVKTTEPIGVMGEITETGKAEITRAFNSKGEWVKGRLNGADMQIDHTTKKYSLSPPEVSFEMEGTEWRQETYFNPAKKISSNKSVKYNAGPVSLNEIPEFFEGDFEEGQKEITIRKRIPVTINMEVTVGVSSKLLTKKGYIDFYLVLKRLSGTESGTVNKSSTPQPLQEKNNDIPNANKPVTTPADSNQKTTAVTDSTGTKKKKGIAILKNKIGNLIRNN